MGRSTLAVCLAVIGLGSPVLAQGLQFGAKGGVNLSKQSFDQDVSDVSFNPLVGLAAGGFVIWPLGGRLDVEAEGLYSVKGVSLDLGVLSTKTKVDYVDVPVLARYRIAGSPTTRRIHIVGGPVFGFRVRAQTISDFGNGSFHRDVKDDVKPFDFGVAAGADVEFGRFIVDGRYTFGLTSINEDPDEDGVKVTNRAFTFLGGIRF
jgi:Outer membrane protein beta-barrel domain